MQASSREYPDLTWKSHRNTIIRIFLNHLSWIYYYYYYFLLYNIVLVLRNINMNPPQVYTCSPSWTLLPLPSPYHPSGSSQCTTPERPVSCIEPGLASRFLYDLIHVSMPFSQIIPPCPFPQSPKDCSIHLHLIHIFVWYKPTQHSKAIIFQLKKIFLIIITPERY